MTTYSVMKMCIKVGAVYVLESWQSTIVITDLCSENMVSFQVVNGSDKNKYSHTVSWFIDGIHKGKLFFKFKMPVFYSTK